VPLSRGTLRRLRPLVDDPNRQARRGLTLETSRPPTTRAVARRGIARRVEETGARRLSEIYRLGMNALFAEPIMLAACTDALGALGSLVAARSGDR
jgi:hypothetical protein